MKKLTEEQIILLNNVCIGLWTQTNKGIVVVGDVANDDIRISNSIYKLEKIPVKFYKVYGHFYWYNSNLTDLEGCPVYVSKNFIISNNKLTSLEGCPKYIGNRLSCSYNKLTSLEGIGEVKGDIYCYNNKINLKREKELRPKIFKKIRITTLEKMFLEL